jgi:hypothetical protein
MEALIMDLRRNSSRIVKTILLAFAFFSLNANSAELPADNPPFSVSSDSENAATNLWIGGVGKGFPRAVRTLNLVAGAGAGLAVCGSLQAHDLAILSLS